MARNEVVNRFPGETPAYRRARNRLLKAEVNLRRQIEAVAAQRRKLPLGGVVEVDYVFETAAPDGGTRSVRLSDLFADGKRTLLLYNFMFPERVDSMTPCPSCTSIIDAIDGAARHVAQRINFAVIAKAPIERLTAFAMDRGWKHLKLLSSASNRFKNDYGAEDADGQQQPMCNVFHRTPEGIRHFWSSEMLYAPPDPGQDPRHMGTVEPLWTMMDFTREGRHDWQEQLQYGCWH